jgi:hypothetical protein
VLLPIPYLLTFRFNLDFKTTRSRFKSGEVAREGRSHSWQQITGKEKSGASMDAFLSSSSLTKPDCESAIPICLGTVFTGETVLSGILEGRGRGRGCRISQYSGYQNVMPNVYLSVSSTLRDRRNPVCHLISCPVFLAALYTPFSSLPTKLHM